MVKIKLCIIFITYLNFTSICSDNETSNIDSLTNQVITNSETLPYVLGTVISYSRGASLNMVDSIDGYIGDIIRYNIDLGFKMVANLYEFCTDIHLSFA